MGEIRHRVRAHPASCRMDFISRTLTYTLPNNQRTSITRSIETFVTKEHFTILEAAELHGTLADASRANRQGRTLIFSFQNAFCWAIQSRFNQVRGYYNRKSKRQKFQAQLPKHPHCRIDSMIAREMAALLWSTKIKNYFKTGSHRRTHVPALVTR